MLSKSEISILVEEWMAAWNQHDLEGVLGYMADDVIFEHWNERTTRGSHQLRRLWQPWFDNHGGFHFSVKSLYIDQEQQSAIFEWQLQWPSPESSYRGQHEIREGVDLIQLQDGKVASKRSYIKTLLKIGPQPVFLKT